MPRRLSILASALSLLLCVATAGLWVLSYRGITSIVWARHGVRYEVNSGGGRLIATSFQPWPWQPWFVEFDPGNSDLSPGVGWSGSRHCLAGFEFATGSYLPPFSWQVAPAKYRRVGAPLWFLCLATAAMPVLLLVRFARRHARVRGRCHSCGYDLRATPERCPECGTPVPEKPGTRSERSDA